MDNPLTADLFLTEINEKWLESCRSFMKDLYNSANSPITVKAIERQCGERVSLLWKNEHKNNLSCVARCPLPFL